jgi:hypothetical protein
LIDEFRRAAKEELAKRASSWRVEQLALDIAVADAVARHESAEGLDWKPAYVAREKMRIGRSRI